MADPRGAEIAKLEALFSQNPNGRVFAHLAEAYRRAGELERARALLEAGLERHADYASAHVVHGRVLLDLGLEAEAEVAFRRVLALDPENLVALRALGDLARRAGRTAEALDYYEQLLARDPSSGELEAIVGELRQAMAPWPAEAGDWSPAVEGAGVASGEGTEAGFEGAAAVATDGLGEADEPIGSGLEEAGYFGMEPAVAFEAQGSSATEVEPAVAPEAEERALEVWAEEGGAASPEASGLSAGGLAAPEGSAGAAWEEAEAPGAGESAVGDAARLVEGFETDEAIAPSVAVEAGPEEPVAVFDPAMSEAAPEAVAEDAAAATWHGPQPEDAVALPPEAEVAGQGVADAGEADLAVEDAAFAFDGLTDMSGADAGLAGEAALAGPTADAPPEIALDEELELEIGSLAEVPDATHSLLFEHEFRDPESAAIPLEAWTPLPEESEGAGVVADEDVGFGDLDAGGDREEAETSDLEAAAEDAGAVAAAEPDIVSPGVDGAAPEPAAEPGEAGGPEPAVAAAGSEPSAGEASAPVEPAVEPPAEVAAVDAPAPAVAAAPRGGAVEGPESLGGEVITETLADLYLAQGLFERAAAMYRQLLASRPGDARLEARLREAEDQLLGRADAGAGAPAEGVGSDAAGLEADQRVEDVEAVWTGGAGAAGPGVSPYAWPEEETPGPDEAVDGGVTIGQYLDALLQWKPGRGAATDETAQPAVEPTGEGEGDRGGAAGGTRAADDDDDLEMFRAWLQSLKR